MQSNNEQSNHGHVSGPLKIILSILALVLIGALSYVVWMQNTPPDTTDYSTQPVKRQTPKSVSQVESTPAVPEIVAIACGDKAYAFSLTFGDMWKGYKVKEYKPAEAIIYCYFEMPTTSKDEVWTTATTDHDKGYASIFAVGVYAPAQWTTALTEPNTSAELGKNNNYVWGYSPAQALPDDLQTKKIADDVKNVVATFKIVP
jgi:hypothetical protein